ncbi:mucin-16-like [Hemitrygon akajei]|uniref:mucin-16-like n=1 Tax=Hemitrygon akajei TaxID=2704970 RepID=UPI003BF96DE7
MDDSTRVTANCSFKNETDFEGVIRERVYEVVVKKTNDVSTLGTYELEKGSLLVSDQLELPSTIVPEEETHPIQYYVSFNVRKPSYQEIQSNSTEQAKLITAELTELFLNSSINATFLNCVFYTFREVMDDSTRVTANCSFKNETDFEGVIRERVYEVVVKKTNDVSALGTYELEKGSLLVSDQLELPSTIVPEEETHPIQYYVSFNVRKPSYQEIQSNSTEQAKLITAELTELFLNSSINATFLNCVFYTFREVMDDSTRVTANCSFKNETDFEGVIRERVYEVVVKKTNDVSALGTYELEKGSLLVSDQLELPSTIVPEEETHPIQYYVSFNVRKPSYQEIQSNSTEQAKLITAELTELFLNSSINATFLNCVFYTFREVMDDSTRVTANCSFKNETDFEGVIRERVYEVVVKKTNDVSALGTYELEKGSLLVSDQLELPSTIVPEEETHPIQYYVSFNVRKPSYQEIQSNSTEQAKLITAELTELFLNSSINATFLNCVFYTFREVMDDSTRVTANCSFKNETDFEGVIRERVYEVVVKKTNDVSALGTYELEKGSLLVSDQLELPSTIVPEEETHPIQYYVSFNVRKPSYQEIQSNSTEQAKLITAELTELFLNSSINATFLNCVFYTFREVMDDSTRVTANCSFKNETDFEGVIRERVYEVVVKKTNDVSALGTYELEKGSLLVSDQLELPSTIVPEEETHPIQYYVSFNVRKPSYQEIQSNSTEQAKLITAELTELFLNSSINATFLNCVFYTFREVMDDSTRVTANCSFKNETDFEGVIRERVYEVVVKKTNDVSALGTYELEKGSLLVSDQLELPSTIVPEEETHPIQYYVSFNVRKPSYQEIQSNSTEQAKLITAELTELFLNSSINATFLNCVFYTFREVMDDSTRVTANCSFKNETDFEGVIRERVYEVVVKKTNDVSALGTYELEKGSLLVSDQLELPSTIVPEEETHPIQYYVSFNVRKPSYQEIQSNSTEQAKLITAELTELFLNSSINATFLNCVFYTFREVMDDSTRVTANCSFKNETDFEGVIRERVYEVVVKKTNDVSTLGTYELEKGSLLVSDQMELPSTIVPEEETHPIQYYVSFNVRKPSYQEIQSNSTEQAKLITAEVRDSISYAALTELFLNSSINATFLNCVFYTFREVMDDSTRVTANCSFKNETDFEGVIRERVYEVVVKKTNDVSTLGTYELEKGSLLVSDQMELPSTIVPEEETHPIQYYVSFNVRKPSYQEIQSNSTEQAKLITAEVRDSISYAALTELFLNSSINATFLNCVFYTFREVMDDSTRVTANCSFKNETDFEGVIRERVYEVVVKKTNDVSTLGTYELEKGSLLVSDQMELPSTIVPEEETHPIQYYVSFNVRKPSYQEIQSNSTEQAKLITAEVRDSISYAALTELFLNSSINATFLNCVFYTFREVMDDSTRVTANCSFKNETDFEGVIRERVYEVVVKKTNDVSTLGTYELEKGSLLVSDQMELPSTIVPEEETHPIQYYVSFNVRKPSYQEIQSNSTEQAKLITAEVRDSISYAALTELFLNSSINATYLNCVFYTFREVMDDSTRVTANCSFKNETDFEGVIRERVYEVVVKKTNDVSTLGTYELEKGSLLVSDQMELPSTIVPEEEIHPIQYYVSFNVRKPSYQEIQSNSTEQAKLITAELTDLFLNSSINATFLNCVFYTFREVMDDSTRVTANCSFKNETDFEGVIRERVYEVVVKKTNDVSTLGRYELEKGSLLVSDQLELPSTIVPEEETHPIQYYVSFNVRKPSYQEIQSNSTEQAKLITAELTDLFLNSSINATFLNCVFYTFREVMDDSTRVTANCSFKNETDFQGVIRERVYEVVVKKTNDMSNLGTYELEKGSLLVSGYTDSLSYKITT